MSKTVLVMTNTPKHELIRTGAVEVTRINPIRVKKTEYVICCRHAHMAPYGPEAHGSAFLVGRISGIRMPTITRPKWLIQFDAVLEVDIPNFWRGDLNPIRYLEFDMKEILRGYTFNALREDRVTKDKKYDFDFDIAWDAFEDAAGTVLEEEIHLRKIAKKHGVEITGINYCGPGGGNPNIFATARSREQAGDFLFEVYGCKTQQDREDYVEPCIQED